MRALPNVYVKLAPLALLAVAACSGPASPSAARPAGASTPDAGEAGDDAPAGRRHTDLTPLPRFVPGMSAYDRDPECPDELSLGAGEALPASTSAHDFGLSVTHDELTAAWMTEQGAVVTVHYVDRATAASPFGAARSITGAFAPGRVAVASDGLELVVVDADGLGFSALRREARSGTFDDAEVGPFELLDAQGRDVLGPAGERYADPLFANDDRYFIFSRVTATGAGAVQLGSRFFGDAPFSPGVPFAEEALATVGTKRKTVTGTSRDVRTVFVWDESVSKSLVVRLTARGGVESSAVLGEARDVQPTESCRVFWFTSGSPSDVLRFAAP